MFLGYPDRALGKHRAALAVVVGALLEEIHPDAVFTFDGQSPKRPYVHPDHQAIAGAVWSACVAAPHPPELVLFNSRRPNVSVDVRCVLRRKIAALQAHRSQVAGGQLPRPLRPVWKWAGRRTGFPLVLAEERFRLVRFDAAHPS
jgi:LmbE family N-acetylglucosaminyl deacetylase